MSGNGFMFEVGKEYETQAGERITVIGRTSLKGYECLECSDGRYRYDRSTHSDDAGRCTGTAHDYSDPYNLKRADRQVVVRCRCDGRGGEVMSTAGIEQVSRPLYLARTKRRCYLSPKSAANAEAGAILSAKYPTERAEYENGHMIYPGYHWAGDEHLCRVRDRLARMILRSFKANHAAAGLLAKGK